MLTNLYKRAEEKLITVLFADLHKKKTPTEKVIKIVLEEFHYKHCDLKILFCIRIQRNPSHIILFWLFRI